MSHLEVLTQWKRSVIRLSWDAKEGILSAEGSGGKVLLIIQTLQECQNKKLTIEGRLRKLG